MKQSPGASSATKRPSTDVVVFGIAALLVLCFLGWGVVAPEGLGAVADAALNWAVSDIGWWFALVATGFVVFVAWLALSRYGTIPLGHDGDEPEFRTLSWIAMMFIAGMGIGLMFFGVAEPLAHYVQPPPDAVAPTSEAAVRGSLATSLFHWALHPWAIYSVVGLTVAYGTFRRGRRQLISSAFPPVG